MRLALTRGSTDAPNVSESGWFLRMRTWFKTFPMARVASASCVSTAQQEADMSYPSSAQVFSFPLRGDALLVKLRDILKARIAETAGQIHRFDLSLTRAPRLRLTIDEAAYVEFDIVRSAFRIVVDTDSETHLTLDTTNFDMLVRFVVQYVRDKLTEASEPEAAA